MLSQYFELENGDRMPRIGYGTWQTADDVMEKCVEMALEAGYRHFDTAHAYENEAGLGRALKKWIGVDKNKRKELFVVTKLPAAGLRPESIEYFFQISFQELGLDYIDLYLLHTPFAFEEVPGDLHPKNPDGSMKVDLSTDLIAVWKTMQTLKETGRVRHLGVSNLNEEQLKRLCTVAKPACLQIEVHVLCQQKSLVAEANKMNIPIVAYSPLGSKALADALSAQSGRVYPNLLQLTVVTRIAKDHDRTPAQILLRYLLQRGLGAIPKSNNVARMKENIDVWNFDLSSSEMAELSELDRGENGRICDFSFFIGVDKHPEFPFKKQPVRA